ncbi:MAG: TM1266 family iron-only hydrogenase system putative regulator [Lachnospiraceae bacterium]|nr:TM1266 family iron-only hydrogenase system putative regulator [Lachnospiraceae bacterium]
METKIALVGIIVHDTNDTEKLNQLLHDYQQYIVGRMGIPYSQKGVNIISVVLDAPENIISSLSGKLGMMKGITVKSMIAKTK